MTRIGGIAWGAGAAATVALVAVGAAGFLRAPSDPAAVMAPVAVDPASRDTAAPATETSADDSASAQPDTATPAETATAVTSSEAPGTPRPPDFDVVRIDQAGSALVAGRAKPGQDISLILDGETVAKVTTDSQGNFVSFFDVPMADIPQVLSLEAAEADGSVQASADSIIVTPLAGGLDATADDAAPVERVDAAPRARDDAEQADPVETTVAAAPDAPTPPEPIDTPALPDTLPPTAETEAPPVDSPPRLLRSGPDGLRVLADGESSPSVQTELGIDAIGYNAQGEVQLAGTASGGADLRVYLDNRPVQTVQADSAGTWASQLTDVPPGVYTLRIDAIRPDGGVDRRIETPFERIAPDLAAILAEDIDAITVQPGFTLWAISEGHFGDGLQYVQIFEANRDIIRDPDLIYPGQVFALPDPG